MMWQGAPNYEGDGYGYELDAVDGAGYAYE